MTLLGVNIDHVATLREARKVDYPDPVIAARIAEKGGADQITCHLREDRRHIQDRDLPAIMGAVDIHVNLEMAATQEMLKFAIKFKPKKVTIVPERREELTTEGGLDVISQRTVLKPMIKALRESGIFVALFVDPNQDQIAASREVGSQSVEIHTGTYCNAEGIEQGDELEILKEASRHAKELGFFVAAGHGLHYQNILPVKKIVEIEEYNIGHSIVAHAVFVGLERAVREMKELLK